MAKLSVGTKAPAFNLTDKTGKKVSLSSITSKYIVVYFYPKDDTPGCTIEAKEFNDALALYKKAGAAIIGISGGTDASKQKFCTKYKLSITLLTDADFSTAKAYGSYGKKQFMGREYMGIIRNTFLLDANRKIVAIFNEVTPKGHAKEVLTAITKGGSKKATPKVAVSKKIVKKAAPKKTAAVKKTTPKKPLTKARPASRSKSR